MSRIGRCRIVILVVVVALPVCRLRTLRWSMSRFFLTFGAGSTRSLLLVNTLLIRMPLSPLLSWSWGMTLSNLSFCLSCGKSKIGKTRPNWLIKLVSWRLGSWYGGETLPTARRFLVSSVGVRFLFTLLVLSHSSFNFALFPRRFDGFAEHCCAD